jgi:glycosyltransferase involved in cell wall biosynthesis
MDSVGGRRIKVLHVITSLDQGGAEAVMYRLILTGKDRIEHVVISLKGDGYYGDFLRQQGIELHCFELQTNFRILHHFIRLVRLIARISPDVVQTWMYHSDLIGGLAAKAASLRPVVWGVRTCSLSTELASSVTRKVAWACARLSGLVPDVVACCSVAAVQEHVKLGYRADKFRLIPNGFDLETFAPDVESRRQVRASWGVGEREVLIGCVARWNPYKDHANLFQALHILILKGLKVRCVLIGGGMVSGNPALADQLAKYDLARSIILAGSRPDVPAVMNALDLHVLPSASEAFPNVVAEAMACGTPCVATDVGDAALIIGDTGWTAPAKNPAALAQVIEEALADCGNESYSDRRARSRKRIVDNFGLEKMSQAYSELWRSLINKKGTSS